MAKKVETLIVRCAADIKQARLNAGLTMQQVAEAAGVSRRHITQIESGQVNLTLETIERVAKIIGVNVKFIFE